MATRAALRRDDQRVRSCVSLSRNESDRGGLHPQYGRVALVAATQRPRSSAGPAGPSRCRPGQLKTLLRAEAACAFSHGFYLNGSAQTLPRGSASQLSAITKRRRGPCGGTIRLQCPALRFDCWRDGLCAAAVRDADTGTQSIHRTHYALTAGRAIPCRTPLPVVRGTTLIALSEHVAPMQRRGGKRSG